MSILVAAILNEFLMPILAMPATDQSVLNSENIASRALRVAESTHSTGHCYAAVSRALQPLGVDLSGEAAYQAQSLLLADRRFAPLYIHSVRELSRGDIVVYTRSSTHPYGHISVYEGNYTEASDHVAPITHTQAYGGATVFRLRSNLSHEPAIALAPDYSAQPAARVRKDSLPSKQPTERPQTHSTRRHFFSGVVGSIKREYSAIALRPLERKFLNKCWRFWR
jgi:hypothetical protein